MTVLNVLWAIIRTWIVLGSKPNILFSSDPNHRDMDDEVAIMVAILLHKMGLINLVAVIVNTNFARFRARIARGMLDQYGLHQIPVGIGSEVMTNPDPCEYLDKIHYYRTDQDHRILDGNKLFIKILKYSRPKSLVILGIGPFTDIANMISNHSKLFRRAVRLVVLMSGVEDHLVDGYLFPNAVLKDASGNRVDGATNNRFDPEAAYTTYRLLQEFRIPFKVLTRDAAYIAMLGKDIFLEMGEMGKCFDIRVRLNTQDFWRDCCLGIISETRNRKWFVDTFCEGIDPPIPDGAPIEPYLTSKAWPLYDVLALLVASGLYDEFFTPKKFLIGGVWNEVIGWSKKDSGIKNPEEFLSLLRNLVISASSY